MRAERAAAGMPSSAAGRPAGRTPAPWASGTTPMSRITANAASVMATSVRVPRGRRTVELERQLPVAVRKPELRQHEGEDDEFVQPTIEALCEGGRTGEPTPGFLVVGASGGQAQLSFLFTSTSGARAGSS